MCLGLQKCWKILCPPQGPCSLASGEEEKDYSVFLNMGLLPMGIKIESLSHVVLSYAILFFKDVFYQRERSLPLKYLFVDYY